MYVVAPWNKPVYYVFAAVPAAAIFLLWRYFRRDKEIVFGAAFFATMLLPVLQFFPFGPVISADRYTYLSSVGVFIILAVCARRLWRRLGSASRGVMTICAVCAVLLLAATARVRCAVWKDGVSLWSDTFSKQPQAPSALGNLCGAYMQAGMNREAEACLFQAIRTYPGTADNYYNLGLLYARSNDSARAREYFDRTLGLAPCHASALNSIGNLYLAKGKSPEALHYYGRAVRCDNVHAAAYLNLGDLALLRKDKAAAVSFYEKAIMADPADEKTRALLKTLR
jgi:tetratricopeptide (TPR) repeat protein